MRICWAQLGVSIVLLIVYFRSYKDYYEIPHYVSTKGDNPLTSDLSCHLLQKYG